MSMRVTMRDPRRSEDGLSVLLTGQTYTVSDEFGKYLVSLGAIDTDNIIATRSFAEIDQLISGEARLARALIAGNGIPGAALTANQISDVMALLEAFAYVNATRLMPLRNGILAPSIQFRGAADTTASLGALGLTVNAANNTEGASILKTGVPTDVSTINGASTTGRLQPIQIGAAVTTIHIGQVGMSGTYALQNSGAVSASATEYARLDFDIGDDVRTLLWYESPPTNFSGTPGTGSARQVIVLGISSLG